MTQSTDRASRHGDARYKRNHLYAQDCRLDRAAGLYGAIYICNRYFQRANRTIASAATDDLLRCRGPDLDRSAALFVQMDKFSRTATGRIILRTLPRFCLHCLSIF